VRELDCRQRKLLLFAAFRLKTSVCASGEFRLEFLDSSSRIHIFQLARVERMASRTNVDLQFLARAATHKRITTATGDLGFEVFWMQAFFHGDLPFHSWYFADVSYAVLAESHSLSSPRAPLKAKQAITAATRSVVSPAFYVATIFLHWPSRSSSAYTSNEF
jgi:hypothetical protein